MHRWHRRSEPGRGGAETGAACRGVAPGRSGPRTPPGKMQFRGAGPGAERAGMSPRTVPERAWGVPEGRGSPVTKTPHSRLCKRTDPDCPSPACPASVPPPRHSASLCFECQLLPKVFLPPPGSGGGLGAHREGTEAFPASSTPQPPAFLRCSPAASLPHRPPVPG